MFAAAAINSEAAIVSLRLEFAVVTTLPRLSLSSPATPTLVKPPQSKSGASSFCSTAPLNERPAIACSGSSISPRRPAAARKSFASAKFPDDKMSPRCFCASNARRQLRFAAEKNKEQSFYLVDRSSTDRRETVASAFPRQVAHQQI